MSKTILIVASEPSGSRLGAALMAELNKRFKNRLRWVGVGGPDMEVQGLKSAVTMSDLAVMGVVEILPAVPRILGHLNTLKTLAEKEKPALIITIDGQDFSKRLAKKLKPLGIPHVHYVAPKVWAWRPWRVKKLASLYTKLLCNLPFEQAWFDAANLPTTYVGHPMVEALSHIAPAKEKALQLALLPGSRKGELQRHWPLFLATYRRLKKLQAPLTGVLVLPDAHAEKICRQLAPWGDSEGLEVLHGESRFEALASCRAALAKSGTNNLELAMLDVPAVVAYKMNALTYWLAKKLVSVNVYSLPNLILNPPLPLGKAKTHKAKEIAYPEFIQAAAKPENLARALYPLLTQAQPVAAQRKKLAFIRQAMETEKPAASLAADALMPYLS